jgi:hypothetical protein
MKLNQYIILIQQNQQFKIYFKKSKNNYLIITTIFINKKTKNLYLFYNSILFKKIIQNIHFDQSIINLKLSPFKNFFNLIKLKQKNNYFFK